MSTKTFANATRGLPSFFDLENFFTPIFLEYDNVSSKNVADIKHNDESITIDLVLAGIPKENINVEVIDETLKIEAKKDEDTNIKKKYTLPDDIDIENISAKYENGILNVVLPKSVKVEKTKIIEIT